MVKFCGIDLDTGCYADYSYGWEHVREILADLFVQALAFNGGYDDGDVQAALRADQSEDGWEEYAALDSLNDATVGGYWEFNGEAGALLLVDEEEEE